MNIWLLGNQDKNHFILVFVTLSTNTTLKHLNKHSLQHPTLHTFIMSLPSVSSSLNKKPNFTHGGAASSRMVGNSTRTTLLEKAGKTANTSVKTKKTGNTVFGEETANDSKMDQLMEMMRNMGANMEILQKTVTNQQQQINELTNGESGPMIDELESFNDKGKEPEFVEKRTAPRDFSTFLERYEGEKVQTGRLMTVEELPTFDNSKSMDIDAYLGEVERICLSSSNTAVEWIHLVMKGLKGNAKIAKEYVRKAYESEIRKNECERNFDSLKETIREELLEHFLPKRKEFQVYSDFFRCAQKDQEQLSEYYLRMKTCILNLGQGLPEKLLIYKFIDGLKNEGLRLKLVNTSFVSLKEVYQQAETYLPEVRNKSFNNRSNPARKRNTKKDDIECYRCHRKGHLQKDCYATKTIDGKIIQRDNPPIKNRRPPVKEHTNTIMYESQDEKENMEMSMLTQDSCSTYELKRTRMEKALLEPLARKQQGYTQITAIDIGEEEPIIALLDSGSEVSILQKEVLIRNNIEYESVEENNLITAGGIAEKLGTVTLPFYLGNQLISTTWIVVDKINIPFSALIGTDVLHNPDYEIETKWEEDD